ncbi:hypothetical protein GCM10009710_36530 [Aeromicrobium alkaliterrae]|uniref:Uncharacterized protein n=1 Tax=Aeromicrobium alkaliterrae TaxID=302168 RepID=A0ABN2KDL6_9ACTN
MGCALLALIIALSIVAEPVEDGAGFWLIRALIIVISLVLLYVTFTFARGLDERRRNGES